jgi:hypothetical protein
MIKKICLKKKNEFNNRVLMNLKNAKEAGYTLLFPSNPKIKVTAGGFVFKPKCRKNKDEEIKNYCRFFEQADVFSVKVFIKKIKNLSHYEELNLE